MRGRVATHGRSRAVARMCSRAPLLPSPPVGEGGGGGGGGAADGAVALAAGQGWAAARKSLVAVRVWVGQRAPGCGARTRTPSVVAARGARQLQWRAASRRTRTRTPWGLVYDTTRRPQCIVGKRGNTSVSVACCPHHPPCLGWRRCALIAPARPPLGVRAKRARARRWRTGCPARRPLTPFRRVLTDTVACPWGCSGQTNVRERRCPG